MLQKFTRTGSVTETGRGTRQNGGYHSAPPLGSGTIGNRICRYFASVFFTVMVIGVLLTGGSTSVLAEEHEVSLIPTIPPRKYMCVNAVETSLHIRGGIAGIDVTVRDPQRNAAKIQTTATLQRRHGKSWVKTASWKKTSKGQYLKLSERKAVSKGTYRVKNVTRIYRGRKCETVTEYSPERRR